jgi:hypothetical protein
MEGIVGALLEMQHWRNVEGVIEALAGSSLL